MHVLIAHLIIVHVTVVHVIVVIAHVVGSDGDMCKNSVVTWDHVSDQILNCYYDGPQSVPTLSHVYNV